MSIYRASGWHDEEHPDQQDFDNWLVENEDAVHQIHTRPEFRQWVQNAIDNHIDDGDLEVDWDAPDDEEQTDLGEWTPNKRAADSSFGDFDRFQADAIVDRFGRYKPMQGQGSFDWDESSHPREQEAHDGKMPGEFAPKAEPASEKEPDYQEGEAVPADKAGYRGPLAAKSWVAWPDGPMESSPERAIKAWKDLREKSEAEGKFQEREHQLAGKLKAGDYTADEVKAVIGYNSTAASQGRVKGLLRLMGLRPVDADQAMKKAGIARITASGAKLYDVPKTVEAARELGLFGEQQPNPRAWTNNGDGTWTTPNGTVWKKASKDGEVSPVNGKPYRGGELMPIHGLASGLPKPELKPKRDKGSGQSKVDEDGRQKDDWKEPKIRQLTPEQIEREKEGRERQRKWDEITSGIIGKSLGLGDRPHYIDRGWGIAKVWMEEAERIGPEATKKLVDAAKKVALKGYAELYRQKGEADPEAAAQKTLDWRHANWQESLLTQGDVFTKKHKAKNPHTPELRHYVELALEGAGNQIDGLYEIHKALGEAEKHSAQAEVDRYGKVKPMAGQAAFDFDRQEPNKQAESQPAPEVEPEPTHPFAIRLKRYLELKDKAVRAGLKEPRTDLLK